MTLSAKRRCVHACSGPCCLRGPGDSRASTACHDSSHLLTVLRGAYLFGQGEDCQTVYSLLSGSMVLEYVDDAGGVAILRLLRPGDILGLADLFDGHEHRTSARAVDDARLCPIGEAALMGAIANDVSFATRLLRAAAVESHAFADFAQRMASLSVEARVLSLIEELSFGQRRFALPVAKKDLAFMAGTGPEVLSRTLVKLQKAGALWMDGNTVTMLGAPGTRLPDRLAS
jgi:CRP/FNR family transcriptional regulator